MKKNKISPGKKKEAGIAYLFLLPLFIGVILFFIIPIFNPSIIHLQAGEE